MKIAFISFVTLVCVEIALTLAGLSTYYPVDLLEAKLEIVDWRRCDAKGCRFDPDVARDYCEVGALRGRHCVLNSQGYGDTDEFVASDELYQRDRVLALGDSFTFGDNADPGFAYVERVERLLPQVLLWNTGIAATGTNQALESWRAYGPIMRPGLTTLGFNARNDFEDNSFGVGKSFAHTRSRGGVSSMKTEIAGRWGGIYEAEPRDILRYRQHAVSPPPNELERLIGLTRLGALSLRAMDAASPLFEGLKRRAKVDITRELLRQLRDETAAMNSQLLVLMVADKQSFPEPTEVYLVALDIMRELRIPYMEVRDLINVEEHFPIDLGHWNNAGHTVIGARLAECVEAFFAEGSLSACDGVVMP